MAVPFWLRLGVIYGVMGLSIGTILAFARTMLLAPWIGDWPAAILEVAVVAALVLASGLWLMRGRAGWTTNSTLAYGVVGAAVYFVAGIGLNFIVLGGGVQELAYNVALTHGLVFPFLLVAMAVGPAMVTQRA
jgi:hypothetical protein